MSNVIFVDFVNKRRLDAPKEVPPRLSLSELDAKQVRERLLALREEAHRFYKEDKLSNDKEVISMLSEIALLTQTLSKV